MVHVRKTSYEINPIAPEADEGNRPRAARLRQCGHSLLTTRLRRTCGVFVQVRAAAAPANPRATFRGQSAASRNNFFGFR